MNEKKKVLITQSNYIPWKGYFDAINSVDIVILYDDAQYTRRDWRNRNKIKTPNGLLWLTIPVDVKGKFFQKISETKISDRQWTKNHWETLLHNYSKAPCFLQYRDIIENAYLGCQDEKLSLINLHFLKTCCALLDIKTEFRWSSEFDLRGDKSEKLLNMCIDSNAITYYSGLAAKDYLDVSLFEAHGIEVKWMDYSGYLAYPQLYGKFEHEVSILDLIFNTGDGAKKYMKSFLQ
ncbi:hypothetical protein WSM22_17350 [Cytophagales bacterium WSM2-2]|nr:hypothetical protein WSM22_17350 [Cytophagales bacterium WSM2-2]